MNHLKAILLCVALLAAGNVLKAQDTWGLGVRLGDPSGITVKKYMSKNALELSFGRTYVWGHRNWYNDRFNYWYGNQKFGYKEFQYIGYRSSAPLGLQLHYLFNNPVKNVKNAEGLHWYYGIGAQFRFQSYDFDYRYKLDGDPDWYYARGERVTDIDLGVDGVLGLEYRFKTVPFSLFADITLFMEVLDDPFVFWTQGGAGVRYNF